MAETHVTPGTGRAEGSTALRTDAIRNRQRIIEAATELFREQGIDVPLEDVARRAGVGIATLYRRFATRAELTAAAFEAMVGTYVTVVERAVAAADPWEGVVTLVNGLCELQASDAALRDLVTMSFPESPEIDRLMIAAQDQVSALFERAQAAGRLRRDAEPTDIALVLLGNVEIVKRTSDLAPDAWQRYAALQLEALRQREDAAPLPRSPEHDQLVRSLRR